jgi:hypothetical protein
MGRKNCPKLNSEGEHFQKILEKMALRASPAKLCPVKLLLHFCSNKAFGALNFPSQIFFKLDYSGVDPWSLLVCLGSRFIMLAPAYLLLALHFYSPNCPSIIKGL